MAPSGTPERGSLARLARDTACPACGAALRDPVLLPCEHSCCRRCLAPEPSACPAGSPAAGPACPRCRRPCAPGRVRTAVALAVEARIVRRLAGDGTGGAGGTGTLRRARRCSLGAQLRADAAPPPPPRDPPTNAPPPQ